MEIIVQKFGGTSVSNAKNRNKVVEKIIEKYNENLKVVVVVSAIGRKGDPYATDSLIDLVDRTNMKKRELDMIMSCGEIISSVVLSNTLNKKGYDTVVLTGSQAGIITDNNFCNAEVIKVNPDRVFKSLKDNKIVIVAGFQGSTIDGDITTLGRGGSDTSAVLLGEALGCKYVEIYTDVDGIMTADPRIVPEAKVLDSICYSEVLQLAEDGAKVIHPKAVEVAQRSNIKVTIRNAQNQCPGTLISINDNLYFKRKSVKNLINSITYKGNRAQIIVELEDNNVTIDLLKALADNNISIDLINFFVAKKIFTINQEDINIVENILSLKNLKYKIILNCCKISVIGHRMRGIPGIMSKIVIALSKENIDILQSSDSHTTIWCLVKEVDAHRALRALHKEFELEKQK